MSLRYRLALIVIPAIATVAGLMTVAGLVLDPRPLSWYMGLPLFSIVLPTLGVGAAFVWRVRAAKAANVSTIAGPDASRLPKIVLPATLLPEERGD